MNDLRKKRLLLLASKPKNHKRFYSQYCELMREDYTGWILGFAFLTEKGKQWLEDRGYDV